MTSTENEEAQRPEHPAAEHHTETSSAAISSSVGAGSDEQANPASDVPSSALNESSMHSVREEQPSTTPLLAVSSDEAVHPEILSTTGEVSAAQAQEEENYPPEVMSLHAMFPALEPMIIQSVFESVNGDQERATDALLGMSDPEYKSQETQPPAAQSQTDLDEQFARRLVMEDQQRQSDWENQLGYQPRRSNSRWGGGGGGGGGGRVDDGSTNAGGKDSMSDLSGQFNKFTETSSVQLGKFAETSKKTLSSFMTKVKAKVQEFDSNRNNQGSSGSSQGNYSASMGQQQTQYYEPPSAAPLSTSGGGYNQMVGYDSTPSSTTPDIPSAPSPLHNYPAPRRIPVPSAGGETDDIVTNEMSSVSPKPPSTTPGPPAGIDRAKLGMLPKRPVPLSQTPPASSTHIGDEDELDYVENPFEDDRR